MHPSPPNILDPDSLPCKSFFLCIQIPRCSQSQAPASLSQPFLPTPTSHLTPHSCHCALVFWCRTSWGWEVDAGREPASRHLLWKSHAPTERLHKPGLAGLICCSNKNSKWHWSWTALSVRARGVLLPGLRLPSTQCSLAEGVSSGHRRGKPASSIERDPGPGAKHWREPLPGREGANQETPHCGTLHVLGVFLGCPRPPHPTAALPESRGPEFLPLRP